MSGHDPKAWHYCRRVAANASEAPLPGLNERDKPHTAALVACPGKLLLYADTVVARGT